MRYETKIRDDLTREKFGYDTATLGENSHNKVIVECTNCKHIFSKEYRYASKFHQCSIVNGNKKRCFICKQWKNLDKFPKWSGGSGGVGKMCKNCHNSHSSVITYELDRINQRKSHFITDISKYLTRRCYATRKQAKYKQVPFDLTPEYLIDLWKNQNGKCFYSGLDMVSHGKDFGWQRWNSPSLDRQNPDKGYIQGNVVWCCFGINSFKGRFDVDQFENILKKIQWWYKDKI